MSDGATSDYVGAWHRTACILCSINCGLEVRIDGPTIARVRGDKAHPASEGYTCEKGLRIDHYQNGPHRLTTPAAPPPRRHVRGDRLGHRDRRGRRSASATSSPSTAATRSCSTAAAVRATTSAAGTAARRARRSASATRRTPSPRRRPASSGSTASCSAARAATPRATTSTPRSPCSGARTRGSRTAFPQARRILKEIANDPARTLIVVDPRRTESADLADIHLRPRPGGDAHLLAAMLAILVDDGLLGRRLVGRARQRARRVASPTSARSTSPTRAPRRESTRPTFAAPPRAIGTATGGVSIFEDLGIQMAPHSTLNSYLEKLLVLLTGNLGVPGGMNLHSHFASLGGRRRRPTARAAARRRHPSPVTGS